MHSINYKEDNNNSSAKVIGAKTTGGNKGREIIVTNLKETGKGSLRWALNQRGKRKIIFKIAGVIDLKHTNLKLTEPHVTIFGQSAPNPGITIVNGGLIITTHDVIVEHIRIRVGEKIHDIEPWEPDGINIAYGKAKNVIIDHVSVSWAIDENISISGSREAHYSDNPKNITVRNSIISEGLSNSIHSSGEHSKGLLVHDFSTNIAIIGNLFISNMRRNPYFKANTTGVIVNNVIENPGTAAIQLNYLESEFDETNFIPSPPKVDVIGNVVNSGKDSISWLQFVKGKGEIYIDDNILNGQQIDLDSEQLSSFKKFNKPFYISSNKKYIRAKELEEYILENVGARPWDRDPTDKRLINQVREKNAKIIDSPEEIKD